MKTKKRKGTKKKRFSKRKKGGMFFYLYNSREYSRNNARNKNKHTNKRNKKSNHSQFGYEYRSGSLQRLYESY